MSVLSNLSKAKIKKSIETTYTLSPADLKSVIANDLKVSSDNLSINFVIQEVGGDPMDRYPGRNEVTKIVITYTEK
jgi:hypothetical protein